MTPRERWYRDWRVVRAFNNMEGAELLSPAFDREVTVGSYLYAALPMAASCLRNRKRQLLLSGSQLCRDNRRVVDKSNELVPPN